METLYGPNISIGGEAPTPSEDKALLEEENINSNLTRKLKIHTLLLSVLQTKKQCIKIVLNSNPIQLLE